MTETVEIETKQASFLNSFEVSDEKPSNVEQSNSIEYPPTTYKIIQDVIALGTLNMLAECDFSLCMLILNIYLLSSANISTGVASAFMVPFMNITVLAMMQGFNRTLQIYCTQYLSKGLYSRINLIYRQSLVLSILLFVMTSIPSIFAFPFLLRALGITEIAIYKTQVLIVIVIPAMIIRVFADTSKSMLRGLGIFNPLGSSIYFCFLLFLLYSYLFMVVLKLEFVGFGLSLFLYEFSCLISVLYLVWKYSYKVTSDFSLDISNGFTWILCESLKSVLPYLTSWVIAELAVIILTLTKDEVQLAAFAQLTNIPGTFLKLVGAYSGVFVNFLNECFAKNDYTRSLKQFKIFCVTCSAIYVIYLAVMFLIALIIISSYKVDSPIRSAIIEAIIPTITYSYLAMIQVSLYPCCIAFELKGLLTFFGIFFDIILRVPVTFIVVFVYGQGLSGLYWTNTIFQFTFVIIFGSILLKDFKNFKGTKDK